MLVIRTDSFFTVDVEEQKICPAKNVYFVIQITKQSALCFKFCSGRRSSANIVGLYVNFSGPNNFQSLELMF